MSVPRFDGCQPEWVQALERSGHRSVEDQTRSSTRHLVDDEDEHALLEEILERDKPRVPAAALGLLLSTPFRYPPLPHGSRFGSAHERGLFYGSLEERTCLGESAFYQLAFLRAARGARFVVQEKRFTTFSFRLVSKHAVDFTQDGFASLKSGLSDPSSYAASQRMGTSLRARAVEFCLYWSARVEGGKNVVVFSPRAFAERRVPTRAQKTWYASVSLDRVIFTHHASNAAFTFRLESFLSRGEFPELGG